MPFRGLGLRAEFAPMLRLASPVVLAELGWMFMGVVDTLMVGPLGPEAIGAVGVGAAIFGALGIFTLGVMLGLDTLVSQAYGAARLDECHRWLFHGTLLALVLSLPLIAVCLALELTLQGWGLDPRIQPLVGQYFGAVLWSSVPLLLYGAFRRYLQALTLVRPVMFALVSANLVNAAANYVLIYGAFGVPALGVTGAAWATVIARLYMAAFLLAAIIVAERKFAIRFLDVPFRFELARWRRLAGLGFPAATQVGLEVGVFAATTVLAGRFAPSNAAAHQIAMNVAAVSFMVPLGISSAAAVRVGHAVGRRDPAGTARAGWAAILIGVGFMVSAALTFVLLGRYLVGAFTHDAGVIAMGVLLLRIAAVFQLFDGLQGVTTGVLRGIGDTRTPMVWNLAGHWLVGLPLGYWLAFSRGWNVMGLWIGLSVGLTIVGAVLVAVWIRHVAGLRRSFAVQAAPSAR